MNMLSTVTLEKIRYLSDDQLSILDAIIDEFYKKTINSIDTDKRIGVAKGKFSVPDDFDEIDFGTSELFGIGQ